MLKVLNFVKSVVGEEFIVHRNVWRILHNEIRFLLKVVKTSEPHNRLGGGDVQPFLRCVLLCSICKKRGYMGIQFHFAKEAGFLLDTRANCLFGTRITIQ